MSNQSEINMLRLHSEFIGKSQMRVKTRQIGTSATILVDVTELGPTTSKKRAESMAREAARLAGKVSKPVLISDFDTVRPGNRIDPTTGDLIPVSTRVRNSTFAFGV